MNKFKISFVSFCFIIALISMITSCGGAYKNNKTLTDSTKVPAKTAIVNKILPGSVEDAKLAIGKFMAKGADYKKLTNNLKPAIADAKALFITEEDAIDAMAYVNKIYKQEDKKQDYIEPKTNQTDVVIYSATVKDIKADNRKAYEFPGGYKKVSSRLKENMTIYMFEFAKKGEKYGTQYHFLVYVNNHWVMFSKIWKAF
jgi:hypothetical protein